MHFGPGDSGKLPFQEGVWRHPGRVLLAVTCASNASGTRPGGVGTLLDRECARLAVSIGTLCGDISLEGTNYAGNLGICGTPCERCHPTALSGICTCGFSGPAPILAPGKGL